MFLTKKPVPGEKKETRQEVFKIHRRTPKPESMRQRNQSHTHICDREG